MKQVKNYHKDYGLLNMIRRTDPMITIYRTAVPNITVPYGSTIALNSSNTLAVDSINYFGEFVFENGQMSKYLFSGGYATISNGQPTFHYYVQDHLGNNRAVINHNGTLEQVNHYYPFGAIYGDVAYNDGLQKYKYNGKELDRMHGLNFYDYGARQYDPLLGMFTQMDPMAEKYYSISPYMYCAGDPVNRFDPDGRKVYLFSTSLPGASWVPFATHTFLVVQDAKGRITYAAYGPKNNDAISGVDVMSKCNYSSDIKAYTDYLYGNKKSDHVTIVR